MALATGEWRDSFLRSACIQSLRSASTGALNSWRMARRSHGRLAVDPALDVEQHVDPLHRLQRERRDRRRGLAPPLAGRDVGELVELPS